MSHNTNHKHLVFVVCCCRMELEHECPVCGRMFQSQKAVQIHKGHGHDGPSRRDLAEEKYAHVDGEWVIYTLLLSPRNIDGEFYYVGISQVFSGRVIHHGNDSSVIRFPKDGELKPDHYKLVDVVDYECAESKWHARHRERERMLELAIETGRTDILGGR